MKPSRKPLTKSWDIDTEFGIVEVTATYTFDKGEPRVDYYPDGSGSPGVSPSVHISNIDVKVLKHDVDFIRSMEEEILDDIITYEPGAD